MQAATCVLVTAPVETRVRRIIEEYGGVTPDPETLPQLEQALRSLKSFFGNERIEGMVAMLHEGRLEQCVSILLEEYYDPRYLHAMRDYAYALEISSENLDEAAAALARFAASDTWNRAPVASAS